MTRINLVIAITLLTLSVQAQQITNKLLGKFTTTDKNTFFTSFSFDNNGKLTIDHFANADYFIIGDTLIAFPDKDLLKFVIKENGIYGVSNWVKEGIWKKTNDKVIDHRTDEKKANEQAELLNEYYQKTKGSINQMEMIFDKNLFKQYQATLESLCNKNLLRACKEYFGTLTLDQIGGIENALSKNTKEVKPNPALEKIIEKVKNLDKNEGLYLEASYLLMTGKTKEGQELMTILAAEGYSDAILQLYSSNALSGLSEDDTQRKDAILNLYGLKDAKSTEFETVDFSSSKPLKLEDLRLFYNTTTEALKTILKSDYGFKKIDETNALDGGTIADFQNELYDKISKFEYSNSQNNRVEYSTVNKDQINAFIDELKLEKYAATIKKTKNGDSYTVYQKIISKDGKKQTLLVSIMYPKDKNSNEPIIIILY